MLDNWYENIGGKIKGLAKWIFAIEAIAAIITAFVLFFADDSLIIVGIITLVCGPIIAWIGSWILYAFGELVEKTSDNERNTRNILGTLTGTYEKKTLKKFTETPVKDIFAGVRENGSANTIKRCPYCGDVVKFGRCEMCGKEVK